MGVEDQVLKYRIINPICGYERIIAIQGTITGFLKNVVVAGKKL